MGLIAMKIRQTFLTVLSVPPAWDQGGKRPVSCGGEYVKAVGSEGWFCQGWSAEFIDCD